MIFDRNNDLVLEYTYAGDDCVTKLIDFLLENEEKLKTLFNKNLPLTWTKTEREHYAASCICGICGKEILDSDIKAKHHEHYTGKFVLHILFQTYKVSVLPERSMPGASCLNQCCQMV
jgi:hypothetical protein